MILMYLEYGSVRDSSKVPRRRHKVICLAKLVKLISRRGVLTYSPTRGTKGHAQKIKKHLAKHVGIHQNIFYL